jgi:hypothetical protein
MVQVTVPVGEDLSTAYHPDVDYIGGHLEGRNAGEKEHGKLQFRITFLLKRLRKVVPFIETRLRIAPDRYPVPMYALTKKGRMSRSSQSRRRCASKSCRPRIA